MQATIDLERFSSANARMYDRMKALGEINVRTAQKLVQKQMDRVSLGWEMGVRQLQLLQDSKGYQEVLAGEAKLVRESTAEMMENVRETFGVMNEARVEVTAWWQQSAEEVSMPVKLAALEAIPAAKGEAAPKVKVEATG